LIIKFHNNWYWIVLLPVSGIIMWKHPGESLGSPGESSIEEHGHWHCVYCSPLLKE
jgi:hypothetical protein